MLLRHFDACSHLRPSSPSDAMNKLLVQMPIYEKGLTARRLQVLDFEHVQRACAVEPQLRAFLDVLGVRT